MVAEQVERQGIFTADESDIPAVQQFGDLLSRLRNERQRLKVLGQKHCPRVRLVGADGEELELPPPIYDLLQQVVPHLMRGDAVAVVPYHKELTTQQAADFLNMSRQYLITLLESGEIPFTKTGTHRRVLFKDVLAYRDRRHQRRTTVLRDLTRFAEEYGEYD